MELNMEFPQNDTQIILTAIEKLEGKVDNNHRELKQTLFGEHGTNGVCGTVQKHDIILCGIPDGPPGLAKTVDLMKESQGTWNKTLAGMQAIGYALLTYLGLK